MDTDFMNFRDEERFPFETHSFFDGDESTSLDGTDGYSPWEWEQEREINGDIAIIPMSSNYGTDIILSNSPPSKEDFQKIMSEWHQMINLENENAQEHTVGEPNSTYPMEDVEENLTLDSQADSKDLLCINDHDNFDIASYVNETKETKPVIERPKIGGKKIDVVAQRYIVDDPEDCHVDVETISEHDSSPILQANDLDSLLEQFEASEPFSPVTENELTQTPSLYEDKSVINHQLLFNKQTIVDIEKHGEAQLENKSDCKSCSNEVFKEEQKPDISTISIEKSQSPFRDSTSCDVPLNDVKNNKQIIEALPQELIMRIKETGKRKPIAVIPAIPNKRRNATKPDQQGKQKLSKSDFVQLEHNYCSKSTLYPKNPKKDSGFESSEEDERSLIRNQPTVKTADGKLMVSLLKSNTILHNIKVEQPKRKLNLEEYKKRREGFIKSCETSSNNSPANSGCNSPVPEDEQTKIRRYQEKITKMASEILKTPAKSKVESNNGNAVETVSSPVVASNVATTPPTPPPPQILVVPDDMEVKTIVSIGVNTDIECLPICVPPVKHLEEIKPMLQKASVKIDSNSLITSLIENIPKVKHKLPQDELVVNKPIMKTEEHGEDKTILFLPKDRKHATLCDAQVQTESDKSEVVTVRRIRRGSSSSSSTSSRHSPHRCRNSSNSSRYSNSSSSSSRSSSRSRSRSISPWTRKRQLIREEEKICEVEERRVIYVGRISSSCTRGDLRRRFEKFGTITNVSVHFREHADNYGFVTFMNKLDAYEAVEHGNDEPFYPKYDLSFGGRRMFCKTSYSDLDDMKEDIYYPIRKEEDSFDALLRKAQEKLKKRKL